MESEKKSNGALVGLVIIIIILVIGGVYMWQSNMSSEVYPPGAVTNEDSASLSALEQEANTTNTSTGVDASTVN